MQNDLITAIGAMSETCGFFLKQLMSQGFTRKEAVDLVRTYIQSTIIGGKNHE